jgi:ankyrin repeat protein
LKRSTDQAATGDLHFAVRDKNVELTRTLVAKGADVNAKDSQSRTPLIWAARLGLKDIVDVLLAAGARIDVTDSTGLSALAWAASEGHKEVVETLLVNGANMGVLDNGGLTPLHQAAFGGRTEVVRILMSHGAYVDVGVENESGRTPLRLAVNNFWYGKGNRQVIEVLLDGGANASIRDKDGRSSIDEAERLAVAGHMSADLVVMLKESKNNAKQPGAGKKQHGS